MAEATKRAIITGASSGIGLALAQELVRDGYAVAMLARRAELLEQSAAELRARGGTVVALACDVTDSAAVAAAVTRAAGELGGEFDLAIANAGIGIPSHAAKFKVEDAEQMMRVNVFGMFYLFDAVVPGMIARRSGNFAGVASLAGLRGLPTTSVYSASKAAMQAFLEASRIELAPYGVRVTTINPGFIRTPMTEKNRFKMPFLMEVEEAVSIIARGLERGQRVIEFPRPMSLLVRTARLLPAALFDAVTSPYGRRKIDESKLKR